MMSVTLYVWRRNFAERLMGHAALRIDTQYVSFWPHPNSNQTQLIMKDNVGSQLTKHLTEDVNREDMRMPQIVDLSHLDTNRMLTELNRLRENEYNMVQMNCATFAARLMFAGSSREQSFTPTVHPADYLGQNKLSSFVAAFHSGQINSWTPEHLLTYAEELNASVARTIPLPAPRSHTEGRYVSTHATSLAGTVTPPPSLPQPQQPTQAKGRGRR
jgi:hypothetical protein